MKSIRLVLIFSVFQFTMAIAQKSNLEKELIVWFDSQIGLDNTPFVNGTVVVEEYPGYPKGSHKYFSSRYFTRGNLNYLGQDYYNILMIYDILEDKLIALFEVKKNSYEIQLLTEKVNSFNIYSTTFVRLNIENFDGFFELFKVYNDFNLYKKHGKYAKGRDASGNQMAAYTFEDLKPEYVLEFRNDFIIIEKKKDLYILFPDIQKKIKSSLSKDNNMRYAWRKKDMISVFNIIQDLLSN